ncbi:hypothetical protein CR513_18259 [Mucuna pruriens]|uniref:Uncharacterized protein n=1 Tax=Mucuna pruriens TaxID=157652 RepID=A0A371H7K7_MUCPR|nr:hypothetical protein CR513_18259 [Mucuna pruriens]
MHICRYVPPWLCQILACMGAEVVWDAPQTLL